MGKGRARPWQRRRCCKEGRGGEGREGEEKRGLGSAGWLAAAGREVGAAGDTPPGVERVLFVDADGWVRRGAHKHYHVVLAAAYLRRPRGHTMYRCGLFVVFLGGWGRHAAGSKALL